MQCDPLLRLRPPNSIDTVPSCLARLDGHHTAPRSSILLSSTRNPPSSIDGRPYSCTRSPEADRQAHTSFAAAAAARLTLFDRSPEFRSPSDRAGGGGNSATAGTVLLEKTLTAAVYPSVGTRSIESRQIPPLHMRTRSLPRMYGKRLHAPSVELYDH